MKHPQLSVPIGWAEDITERANELIARQRERHPEVRVCDEGKMTFAAIMAVLQAQYEMRRESEADDA